MTMLLPDIIVPVPSFQRAYVDFADGLTDAPHDYHLAFGHAALTTAVGGRRWMRSYGGRRLYPNLYVLAVGNSGVDRKTTSMFIARDRVAVTAPDALAADESTREKTVDSLSKRPQQTLFISEYGAWDRAMGRDYNSGSQEMYTHLWDCPQRYVRETKGGGEVVVERPVVSLVACSTPEWFERAVSDADVAAGRWGRYVYVCPITRPARRHEPATWPASLADAIDDVLRRTHALPEAEMEFSDSAKRFVQLWELQHERFLAHSVSAQVSALYSRLGDYVKKFAMLYQIGLDVPKDIDPRIVDLKAASAATGYVDRLSTGLAELFEEELATTVYGRAMRRVREVIGTNGGVDQWTLTRRTQNIDRLLRDAKSLSAHNKTRQRLVSPPHKALSGLADLSGPASLLVVLAVPDRLTPPLTTAGTSWL